MCAQRVLQYVEQRKEEFDKEEAVRLKKKQVNEKAKLKKREKQVEKEREEKRSKRLEHAQKRQAEREQQQQTKEDGDEDSDQEKVAADQNNEEQSEGWGKSVAEQADNACDLTFSPVSEAIDGILNGVLLSLMAFFTWQMYLNRQQPLNFRDFYKYIWSVEIVAVDSSFLSPSLSLIRYVGE